MRIALIKGETVRPVDLIRELGICRRTAVKNLKHLCDKGKLRPIFSGKSGRMLRYEWVNDIANHEV